MNGITSHCNVDSKIKRPDGCSAVHAACLGGHTELVKVLLDDGLNVNDTTNMGSTWDQLDTVKFLLNLNNETLNNHVDTTIKKNQRKSAFHAANSNEHTQILKLLTDVGINKLYR